MLWHLLYANKRIWLLYMVLLSLKYHWVITWFRIIIIIGSFDIFPLISQSDIVSINGLWFWKLSVSVISNIFVLLIKINMLYIITWITARPIKLLVILTIIIVNFDIFPLISPSEIVCIKDLYKSLSVSITWLWYWTLSVSVTFR